MNRTLTCALAVIFSVAVVVPAFAQSSDNFPDVPDNHWAFDALKNLKAAGILVGYPDNKYRGPRGASRYELAVAINAAYMKLKGITDGLDAQIKAINDKLNGYSSSNDLQNLRDALTALQTDVAAMKGWGEDIANLKRLADTFQKELQSLGVDVEAMKKDLGDLAQRVTALEKRKPAVDISGDVNFWIAGGNSSSGEFGLDMDGHINGTVDPTVKGGSGLTGITTDLTVLHEAAFKFSGTNETGPKWSGTLVVGNMLGGGPGQGFGDQSTQQFGPNATSGPGYGYGEGNEDVYIQDLGVKFDTSIAGYDFNATVGRVGYKISPYIYQRIDKTSYFSNDRWDNGEYYFDGGILNFKIGPVKLDIIGGLNPGESPTVNGRGQGLSVNGTPLDPVWSGPINGIFASSDFDPNVRRPAESGSNVGGLQLLTRRQLGADVNIPITSKGNLNLAYLSFWNDDQAEPVEAAEDQINRMDVFGGTFDYWYGRFKLEGGFAQSNLLYNEDAVLTKDNTAWNAKLSYTASRWMLWGGYREIQTDFLAPGDWGRLGIWKNPTNIKGWQVGGRLDITKKLTLDAGGEFDKGLDNTFATTTGLDTDTKVDKWNVDLGYKLNSNLSFSVGYEDTKFLDMTTPTSLGTNFSVLEPDYAWTTFGIYYGLSEASKLTIMYQLSDVKNDFLVSDGESFKGGLLTTQLSVKF